MPYTPMPPEYWRQRRSSNPKYREQERNRDRRRRTTTARKSTNRKYQGNRRARLHNAFVEDVDPYVVFERDGYICQRCRIKCSKDSNWPATDYPTIDHIVAIANGGLHSYENTQCLCYRCNTTKGDRE